MAQNTAPTAASQTPQRTPSSAQPTSVPEIIVTATRQAEPISKVPISITAFSQEQLDARGVRSIGDIAALTPGLYFEKEAFFSGSNTEIAIRGIESNVGASPTGIYIDDTPIQIRKLGNTSSNAFPEVFDLDRVEVLKGPQGTLFGAGAEGGAVRFITPQPSLESPSGYFRSEVSYTDHGDPSGEVGGAYGAPIIDDVLGFRVSAWYRRDGGYVDRVSNVDGSTLDKNANYQDSYVLRGALTWKPMPNVTVTPSVFYQNLYFNDTSVMWQSLSNLDNATFKQSYAFPQPVHDEFVLPSLNVGADLGFAKFVSNTSFFYRSERETRDYTNFDQEILTPGDPYIQIPGQAAPTYATNNQNNFTQEFRLSAPNAEGRFNWVTGVFYSHDRQSTTQIDHDADYDQATLNATGGVYDLESYFGEPYIGKDIVFVLDAETTTTQVAGFFNGDFKITDKLKVTGGVRVSYVDVSDFAMANGALNGVQTIQKGNQHETPVTPKVGFSYQIDNNNLVYFSAAKGYREGGAQAAVPTNVCAADLQALGITNTPTQYTSDSTNSYEIGSKNKLFDGRLSVDASVFKIDWQNIQNDIYLQHCGASFVANLGAASSNGVDLALQGRVTRNLTLGLTVGYVNSYSDSTVGGGQNVIIINKGDRLGGPPLKITASGQYNFSLLKDRDTYVRFDDEYSNSSNTAAEGTLTDPTTFGYDPADLPNPTINVLNLRAGLLYNGWDASLFANNALDAHPKLGQYRLFVGSPNITEGTIRPLSVGLTLTRRF